MDEDDEEYSSRACDAGRHSECAGQECGDYCATCSACYCECHGR